MASAERPGHPQGAVSHQHRPAANVAQAQGRTPPSQISSSATASRSTPAPWLLEAVLTLRPPPPSPGRTTTRSSTSTTPPRPRNSRPTKVGVRAPALSPVGVAPSPVVSPDLQGMSRGVSGRPGPRHGHAEPIGRAPIQPGDEAALMSVAPAGPSPYHFPRVDAMHDRLDGPVTSGLPRTASRPGPRLRSPRPLVTPRSSMNTTRRSPRSRTTAWACGDRPLPRTSGSTPGHPANPFLAGRPPDQQATLMDAYNRGAKALRPPHERARPRHRLPRRGGPEARP